MGSYQKWACCDHKRGKKKSLVS